MFHDTADTERRSMMGLVYAEQLVLWGIRKIVVQQGLDADLPAEFQAAFGGDGDDGLRIFCSFFRLLGHAARKPYEIAPPSTLRVTQDERRILTLLAAAQLAVASGDHGLFEAHLLWISAYDHRPALSRVTLAFATLLAEHGHVIAKAEEPPQMRRPVMPYPQNAAAYYYPRPVLPSPVLPRPVLPSPVLPT